MIVSKQHYGCCGELDAPAFVAFNHLRKHIEEIYRARYGRFTCYEHGRAGSCMNISGTDTCHHMHVHFLPTLVDLHSLIDHEITRNCLEWQYLSDWYNTYGNYLLTGNATAGYHFYNLRDINKDLPPHYIRNKVASALGCTERADWEAMSIAGSTYLDIQTIKDDLSRPRQHVHAKA